MFLLIRLARAFLCLCALASASTAPVRADTLTVFAASSLATALDRIATDWEASGHPPVVLSYGATSALARQIVHGAPADVFVAASPDWMDAVDAAGRVVPGSRRDLLTNRLVIVGPAGSAPMALTAADLGARIGAGRLAMALVDAVPAGIYGRAALQHLTLWEAAAPRVAQAGNVRAALALVATGAAPLGVVYASDAVADRRVAVVAEIPAAAHPPIVYPAAAIGTRDPGAALAFLAHLDAPPARAVFVEEGFGLAR